MKKSHNLIYALLIIFFLVNKFAGNAFSQSDQNSVPADLQPWINWVVSKHPEWQCAMSGGDYQCVWPGSISYIISEKSGRFSIKVQVLSEDYLELPSSANLYPANIEVKDQAGQVIYPSITLDEGKVSLKLKAGEYAITGEFFWQQLPSEVPVPSNYGLFDLKFEGVKNQSLEYSRLDSSIRFQDKEKVDKSSSLNLKVFRKLQDASPLTIETLIRAQISGGARSFNLGKFLPVNSHLINVSSSLPYQISADGNLSLQLLPGEYDLYFTSVLAQPVKEITLPEFNQEAWPPDEVWSWTANQALRSVEINGATPIDASLTELPDEWKNADTYILQTNSKFILNELRRGKEDKPFSNLNLNRSLWIDLDGKGYTVADNFSGEMQQVSRLNALKETKLGRADLNGTQQLITIDPETNLSGVEVRDTQVALNTVSRLDRSKSISAVGWNTNVNSLNISLNLPPSWMLLATLNTGYAQNSWFESWSLFEVFILILIIISSYKIFGSKIAFLIGLAGVINYREFMAPNILIIHLILLEVCRRLVKNNQSFFYRLFHWLLVSTYALWALAGITFTKLQFTQVLFPLLQSGTRYRTFLQEILLSLENSLFSWPLLLVILAIVALGVHKFFTAKSIWKKLLTVFVFGMLLLFVVPFFISTFSYYQYSSYQYQQAANTSYLNEYSRYEKSKVSPPMPGLYQEEGADLLKKNIQSESRVFQSGPATPDWKWRSYNLSVSGPVSPKHEITLFLLPPSVTRSLAALRSIVSVLLIILIFRALNLSSGISLNRTAASVLLLPFLMFHPLSAKAEEPSGEVMKELEDRIAAKLCKSDECAVIRDLKINLESTNISLSFDVTSNGVSSVLVPGPIEAVTINKVLLNGKETYALRNSENNFLEVKTQPGNNRIEVKASIPDANSFALEFEQKPLHTSVSAPGWYIEGLSSSGEVLRGLHLTREEAENAHKISETEVKASLTSWIVARRLFHVGESISVITRLERMGDVSSAMKIELPLLPGEVVTNKDVVRESDKLLVYIPAGQNDYVLNSNLPLTEQLTIHAKPEKFISEVWTVECENFIACKFSGLKPTATNVDSKQSYIWHPFPEEEIKIAVKSLNLADGEFLTIDKVSHDINWGANRRSGKIAISLRATKQLSFEIKLDESDKIENVLVDNIPGTSKNSDSVSSILLSPGNHEIQINYAKEWQAKTLETATSFSANTNLHNVNISINPSSERWVVWTGGGFWGPSVVFWSKIIVLVFILHILVRVGLLDLSIVSTLLFGLGLATLPVILVCIPLIWLALLKFIPLYADKVFPGWKIPKAVIFWLLSLITLMIFYHMVRSGLVLQPPMLIVGNNSNYNSLRWFFDHAGNTTPSPWVVSFPIWYWRAIALVWSGWFVIMLFEWLKKMVEVGRDIIK